MSTLKPGQRKEARQSCRTFRNALRGASFWAVAPVANLEALHSAWLGLGLEVAA